MIGADKLVLIDRVVRESRAYLADQRGPAPKAHDLAVAIDTLADQFISIGIAKINDRAMQAELATSRRGLEFAGFVIALLNSKAPIEMIHVLEGLSQHGLLTVTWLDDGQAHIKSTEAGGAALEAFAKSAPVRAAMAHDANVVKAGSA